VFTSYQKNADFLTNTMATLATAVKGTEEDAPEDFFCSVSAELMRDPVTTCDGHTYERSAIERWFQDGHDTSPLTGARLANTNLTPNIALRNAIIAWEEKHLLLIRRNALKKGPEVAAGSFKSVYRGTYQLPGAREPIDVAILQMRAGSVATESKMFLRLGRHPRLVRFYGQCTDGEHQMLVTEFAPLGSLSDWFFAMEDAGTLDTVTMRHRVAMMLQICQGMEKLASEGIIHRDLAARNVLLFHFDPTNPAATSVKVTDFGLSVGMYGRTHATVRGNQLPDRYLSPEVIQRRRFSEKSDVWAFGVTMWEILTNGSFPYALVTDSDILAYVFGGGRLSRPDDCPDDLWSIVQRCWATSPAERPTFAEVGVLLGGQISAQGPVKERKKNESCSSPCAIAAAQEEARRKVEGAVQEEAQKKAEEAAEEEARRKAEEFAQEQARKKADEEAAEEEAQRKADEAAASAEKFDQATIAAAQKKYSGKKAPLCAALEAGDEDAAEALLDGGDDPNEVDEYGMNALHWAAENGCRLPLFHRILGMIHNVNAGNDGGMTALMRATIEGHVDMVVSLMNHRGIDVNVQDRHNFTALSYAVYNNHPAIVAQLLRDDRVDTSLKMYMGTQYNNITPLKMAIEFGHHKCVKILREHGVA
jgi:hypothetical protein